LLGHLATPSPRSGLRVREPRRLPRGLRREEVAELLASFRTVRDQAIAGLMLFSGLRSAEVLALAVDDVDIALGWVRVRGKGDKERRVPVDREVCALVQSYVLGERPDSQQRALFLVAKGPTRGWPLSAAGLRTIFRYHRQSAGVPAGNPHALRHKFGTALAEAGVGLPAMQALLATSTSTRPWPMSISPRRTCAPLTMLPAPASSDPRLRAAPDRQALIDAYVVYLGATGRQVDARYRHAAERFFDRWPDPAGWAAEPLAVRRRARGRTRTLLTFLMLQRQLRPGYDYLLDVTLLALWRELPASSLHEDLAHFRAASQELGFTAAVSKGAAGLVCARLLIQTGRPLAGLTDQDIADFDQALREREQRTRARGRPLRAGAVLGALGVLPARHLVAAAVASGAHRGAGLRRASGAPRRDRPATPDDGRLPAAARRAARALDGQRPGDEVGALRWALGRRRPRPGEHRPA
jgi:hypothetical protein